MSGYLHSADPSGMNRRINAALKQLDRYEHTETYKAYRAQGLSIRKALSKCAADEGVSA